MKEKSNTQVQKLKLEYCGNNTLLEKNRADLL